MKKFVLKIFLFAVIVAAIDLSFGLVMDYMHDHSKGSGMAKRLYMAREAEDEIMLFGSSRMNHHYNPMIIEDSLQMTCFNAGQDGNGVIMSYGFLKMMLERYTPKLVLYDISQFDFAIDDNMKYISLLKPYYKEPSVKEIIIDVSPMDRYKMASSLYKYNSLAIRVIGSYLSSSSGYTKGYSPLLGKMNYDVDVRKEKNLKVDSVKMHYLQKFINLCKDNNVALLFSLSPKYKAESSSSYDIVKVLAKEMGVPVLDNYANTKFSNSKEYFQDQIHLNSTGADEYTRYLIPFLKEYLSNDEE